MEFNKILAAVLTAGIIGMATGILGDMLVEPKELEEAAFHVDTSAVTEAAPAGAPAAPTIQPISPLLASADVAAGQEVSQACIACHTFGKGGANKQGPNNWGVVGAPMGHKEDFPNYSPALEERHAAGDHWGYEELNQFLANPRGYIPNTTMTYAGVKKEQDRANLIAWLREQSDSPPPLPEATAEAAPAEAAPAEAAPAEAAPSPETPAAETPAAEPPAATDAPPAPTGSSTGSGADTAPAAGDVTPQP